MKKKLEQYVDSIFYPISLAVLSLIAWLVKFPIPSSVIFGLLAFLPLFGKDGRGYIALIILCPTMISSHISFSSLDIALIISVCCIVVSVILFTIIRHPHFRLGKLTIYLSVLYVIFIISFAINSIKNDVFHQESLWFLLCMIFILLIYVILTPLLYEKNVFNYFLQVMAVLVSILAIEILVFYGKDSYLTIGQKIDLGWVESSTMASTIFVVSLPFLSMFISKKKWLFLIPLALDIVAIYQLRTVSGLICSILVIIPLVFLTFKNYVHFPYLVIGSFFLIGIALGVLLVLNDKFLKVMGDSLRYFASFFKGEIYAHKLGIDLFLEEPWFGQSINSLCGIIRPDQGYISLLDNTIITTLVMGGSIGLISYIAFLVRLYSLPFTIKSEARYFFFAFLACASIIGLIDNTFYNLFFLFILMLTCACYESTNAQPKVVVEQNFFKSYASKRKY